MTKRKICTHCQRPINVCYCDSITRVENLWPIVILQYFKESKHPLGTANIAALSLKNCHLRLSNDKSYHEQNDLLLKHQPLLIYPGKDSTPIEDIALSKPRPLLFLDGTWRKTRRLLHESLLMVRHHMP